MQTDFGKPDKVSSTIKAMSAGVFLCIPVIWLLGIVTARDRPVPIDVRGCYKSGDQTLQVQSTRIILNHEPTPKIDVRYKITNVGRQIETVNGSWLQLNEAKPPYKQVGRKTILRVEDNALIAFTSSGEAVPFVRTTSSATCSKVVDRPSPA